MSPAPIGRPSRHSTSAAALLLAAQPWDWLAPLLRAVNGWLESETIRQLPANAGLFLITGGLSILTLIVSLVFLQSVLPVRGTSPIAVQHLPAERELRPLPSANQGGRLPLLSVAQKRALNYHAIDDVLDTLVAQGRGEPRLLDHDPRSTRLRVFLCPSCRHNPPKASVVRSCSRERHAIENAFQQFYQRPVVVTETQCRLRGETDCDFEVDHP